MKGVDGRLILLQVFEVVQDGIRLLPWLFELLFGRKVLVCLYGICGVRPREWKVLKWIENFRDGRSDVGNAGLGKVEDVDVIWGRRVMMVAQL